MMCIWHSKGMFNDFLNELFWGKNDNFTSLHTRKHGPIMFVVEYWGPTSCLLPVLLKVKLKRTVFYYFLYRWEWLVYATIVSLLAKRCGYMTNFERCVFFTNLGQVFSNLYFIQLFYGTGKSLDLKIIYILARDCKILK